MSRHSDAIASTGYSTSIIKYQTGKELLAHSVHRKFGDTSFVAFYGLELLAGRNLRHSDSVREAIINETYLRKLGFTQPSQALGQVLIRNSEQAIPIVGVVRDFHIQPLNVPIEPVMIANEHDDFTYLSLKLKGPEAGADGLQATLAAIEGAWGSVYPEHELNLRFLDESVEAFYQEERKTAKLVRTAMGVAILISCLGLFGLMAFLANQRTKEIGIRKVLGATVRDILILLSWDFLLPILLASLIAFPIGWLLMRQWLADYAYRIDLSWWMVLLVALLAIVLALVTVLGRAYQAATANPVDSLKYE